MAKDTLTILREVSIRLREASDELEEVTAELSDATEVLAKARLVARAHVLAETPKMRLPDVEMFMEIDPDVEAARVTHASLMWRQKALKERLHTDRQVLSAWQTQGRIEADLSR